jgi:hypothetical protein
MYRYNGAGANCSKGYILPAFALSFLQKDSSPGFAPVCPNDPFGAAHKALFGKEASC